ncbi:hypothetical protein M9458_016784, partial [Cirrhinus mrigala]
SCSFVTLDCSPVFLPVLLDCAFALPSYYCLFGDRPCLSCAVSNKARIWIYTLQSRYRILRHPKIQRLSETQITMDPALRLFRLRQGNQPIEHYVMDFCELCHMVAFNDVALKDIFRVGLNDPIRSWLHGGKIHWTLEQYIDHTLLLSGSAFTVGMVDEDEDPPVITKPAPANVTFAKPQPPLVTSAKPRPAQVMSTKPQPAHVTSSAPRPAQATSAAPGPAHVMAALPESAPVMAALPESAPVMAAIPEPVHKMATITKPVHKMAAISKPVHKMAAIPEPVHKMATITKPVHKMAAISKPVHKMAAIPKPVLKMASPSESLAKMAASSCQNHLN